MCGCVLMIIREIKERVEPSRPFSSIDSGYTTSQWDLEMGIGYTQAQDTKVPPLLNQEVE